MPQDPGSSDGGNNGACRSFDEMIESLYGELRAVAARTRWSGPQATRPTSLLHDAYLKWRQSPNVNATSRAEIVGYFVQIMRSMMCDAARRSRSLKRGGGAIVPLGAEGNAVPAGMKPENVLIFDLALTRLREKDPRQAGIVEMKYFSGMNVTEVAQTLGVSTSTVERELREARDYLKQHMLPDGF
jgi:RNA polymerase sigma factor (TIGR02999 family)